jgi:hypothetical protein
MSTVMIHNNNINLRVAIIVIYFDKLICRVSIVYFEVSGCQLSGSLSTIEEHKKLKRMKSDEDNK